VRRVDGGRVPQVSLGRCVDRVVVAASAVGSIGVDLERTDAEERARAALGTDGDVPTLRAWARTEALLKAAGTGLAVDPRTVRISDPTGRPQVVGDHPAPPAGTRWWLDDLDLGPAHLGALALALPDGPDPLIATRQIDPADLTP
jgi:4'-phosphopantetheinyl transferase